MRLLPPREVETHDKAQRSVEAQRITAIRSHLSREERELNDWNDSIDIKKRTAIEDFDSKIGVYNRTIGDLQEEISVLQEKRDRLMRPLDADRSEITEKLAATEDMLNYLQDRKKEVAQDKKKLEQSQKEADRQLSLLLKREQTLDQREVHIAGKELAVKTEQEQLVGSVESFTLDSNRKNIELLLFESKVKKKEVELAAREKLLAQGQEKIVIDRMRIESQQQSLIAAMAEVKNKN